MPKLIHSTPKYRKHRASGQAVVTIDGKDHYLGPHRSKASLIEYDRLIAEWLVNGRQSPVAADDRHSVTVAEVLARYWRFAKQHYRKDGKPTGTLWSIKQTLKAVRQLYGHTRAADFGPLALRAVCQSMVDARLARETVNKRVGTVKRVFKWAVGEELVPASVHHGLVAVPGLRKGRTKALDRAPVAPVSEATVQATLHHLSAIVADIVRWQRLTGCRPGEVCIVRPCDIDRTGDVWAYRPASHKTEHHDRERVIFIGPKAQAILRPYLLREADAYCFSPADSVKKHLAEKSANRKTPMSCGNVPGSNRKRRPTRKAGQHYTPNTYRKALHRACDLAKVKRWSPNRLRHSAATEIRKRFGLEAAQVSLGHASADVSQIYAERDFDKAREVMRKIG